MARFYARFDHGFESNLQNNSYFERCVITSATASGQVGYANLQAGLIDSRSALSAAMYAQLDFANEDGANGPIIPQLISGSNNITRSAGNLSWTNVYRNTVTPGVVIPADPSTRPTASFGSTDVILVPSSPIDSGTISDSLYTAAGDAIYSVLTQIKSASRNGAGVPFSTAGTPYTRAGTSPSRTLHSIYNSGSLANGGMDMLAWDDFTPGTGLNTGLSYLGNSPLSIIVSVVGSQARFKNDYNTNGYIGFYVSIEGGSVVKNLNVLANGTHAPAGGYIQIGTSYSGQTGPTNASGGGNSTWSWNGSNQLTWQITLPAGTYTITADSEFYDVTTKFAGGRGSVTSDTKTVT